MINFFLNKIFFRFVTPDYDLGSSRTLIKKWALEFRSLLSKVFYKNKKVRVIVELDSTIHLSNKMDLIFKETLSKLFFIFYSLNLFEKWIPESSSRMTRQWYFNYLFSISKYSLFNVFLLQSILIQAWHCDLITLYDVRTINSEIQYQHCHDEIQFEFKKLPFERDHYLHPNKGKFLNSYIVTIPQGLVQGLDGNIIFEDKLIYDFVWQNCFVPKYMWSDVLNKQKKHIPARVAVIAQAGYCYYYHWLVEVLGRLALLEMNNIEYDYIYVPYNKKYMKQTLELWGIDISKIIEACDDVIVEADTLIIPSLVARTQAEGQPRLSHYIPEYILAYVKNKLLAGYKKRKNEFNFSKKVFISRKDAAARKMINENEVFKVFEKYGFQEYVLSEMSIVEQIALFEGAEIIIGSLGSGMTNVMFCKPDVKIFDIFQRRCDCAIYYMCQTLGLEYHPIKTMDFIDANDGQYDAIVPLESLEQVDFYFKNLILQ